MLVDSSGVARPFITSEVSVVDAHEDKASGGSGMGGMLKAVAEHSERPSEVFYYSRYGHDRLSAAVHAETY